MEIIPSHLVLKIEEESNSNKITLLLKNNFKVKTLKTSINNYEQYKKNIQNPNSS